MNEIQARPQILAELQSLVEGVPEMRVGQLLAAMGELCMDSHGCGLWDAADEELLEAVWQFQRSCQDATVTAEG